MTHAGSRLVRILLDANFMTIPGKFMVDVFDQLWDFGKVDLYTLDVVVRELERLALGSGRDSRYAKVGLQLMKKEGVEIIRTGGNPHHTDALILEYAKNGHYTVCTLDRALIKRLKKHKIPVISLRQGRYLQKV